MVFHNYCLDKKSNSIESEHFILWNLKKIFENYNDEIMNSIICNFLTSISYSFDFYQYN